MILFKYSMIRFSPSFVAFGRKCKANKSIDGNKDVVEPLFTFSKSFLRSDGMSFLISGICMFDLKIQIYRWILLRMK
jgi:hypothetical protein